MGTPPPPAIAARKPRARCAQFWPPSARRDCAPSLSVNCSGLHLSHVFGLWAFLSLCNLELDRVAFRQAFVAFGLDCRVVHEHVGPIILADESVTLTIVEPLDLACYSCQRKPP